jgi:hypothetical protein
MKRFLRASLSLFTNLEQAVSQLEERQHRKPPQRGIAKIFSPKTQLGVNGTKEIG